MRHKSTSTLTVPVLELLTVLVFFGFNENCQCAELGLPLIQISHDDFGEDYPEVQEEVHLEDFFWTGSGDGPPDFLKKVHTGISKGKDVIVKTETVVATVYVDGNNEIDIPICLDCFADDGGGGAVGSGGNWGIGAGMPPLNYSATDRRYWLLTVMSGFYTQKDNPKLEEKLARLYRLAFTRQQTRHLGINGAQQIAGIAVTTARERRQRKRLGAADARATTQQASNTDVEILDMAGEEQEQSELRPTATDEYKPHVKHSEWATSSEESELAALTTTTTTTSPTPTTTTADALSESTDYSAYVTLIPWELIQQQSKSEKQRNSEPSSIPAPGLAPLTAALINKQPTVAPAHAAPVYRPQHPLLRDDRVRVIIHNITQVTEDDVQQRNIGGSYDDDANLKIDERPVANQTELVYSVLVNGRPVLAVTAANDMKFVSETEVATVIGKDVYMKAEPYLREPLATPLAPATRSGSVGFIDSIQNNPALVIVSSLAILLLLLLLVALLLMGRAHRKETEVNRTTSRNELLSEGHSIRPSSRGTALDTERSTAHSRDVGVQNYSFESETARNTGEARIHFPAPPVPHSRRDSISSTDNTSDSSVYCPINPPSVDVQRILEEKAANLFEQHKRRHHRHQYDRAEGHEDTVYTTVVSEKKSDKSARHKAKRRYLSENRVGSLETSPKQRALHSSGDEAHSHDENFQRNEAYNPHNNYQRKKLVQQKTIFADKPRDDEEAQLATTQAINKEIIRALQPSERSSDTGSIGSFLSMSSVRAFPKSALPEPLNRVLDPVFVTYYDNMDDVRAPAAVHQTTNKTNTGKSRKAASMAIINSLPSPKAPPMKATLRAASQSDNPDPGVVGPVVWERHKKRMSAGALTNMDDLSNFGGLDGLGYSPIHDPAAIRSHYEGLLEGAMQMYASQDDLPMPLPARDFSNSRRQATKRENRGSSAGLASYTNKIYSTLERPATAQPEKTSKSNQSTQPPSPTTSAWGGSMHGSHSPLVRPLSAGPFHRPEPLTARSTRSSRDNVNAAPLIEAIQTELRRFKHEQH